MSNSAMRDAAETALTTIRGIINGTIARTNNSVFDCRDKLKHALSAPPRNCDVGTADEQEDRFDAFCKHQMYKSGYMSCPDCPIYRKDEHYCKLRWAQMPYESEVKNQGVANDRLH